jgi:aminopeptidase N
MKHFFLFILFGQFYIAFAQFDNTNPTHKYDSPQNPYYWKNKLPYPSYWQQDVAYTIDAELDDQTDVIQGSETLIYTNNSPDTIRVAYFNLYQNAFNPHSDLHDLTVNSTHVKPRYGKYEQQDKNIEVLSLKYEGNTQMTELQGTILKVFLDKPILPHSKVTFALQFRTYFDIGSQPRRMKMFVHDGVKHYDAVHWYPRIAVYDRKFKWALDQHLNREFYGDFGSFLVNLTLPHHYIVEATGVLQNKNQVLPTDLRAALDIKNFKSATQTPISLIAPEQGKKKTWIYYATNVHDFGFTADPSYRIGEANWNGIQVVALVMQPNAPRWQDAAEFTANIIQVYSVMVGKYAYPKMVVADARDGMEYPMLTLCGGSSPTYKSLFAHEVGHNWFFGMIGSNETYRPMLDEGFTQFMEIISMQILHGKYDIRSKYIPYVEKRYEEVEAVYSNAYYSYLWRAKNGYDIQLNTHADDFDGSLRRNGEDRGHTLVYTKTATMLFNLKYVLGDKLFWKGLQEYFKRWCMAHPYEEDFRQAMIDATKVDLNWFFDEWITTKKQIDYGIQSVKRTSKNKVKVTLVRKADMEMPLDIMFTTKKGDTVYAYIPNRDFIKPFKYPNTKILPIWRGWGKRLHPTYTFEMELPNELDNLIIDPEFLLADIDLRDNQLKHKNIIKFESGVYPDYPDWKHTRSYWRPDIWYNGLTGVQTGIQFKSNYFNTHLFETAIWGNTTIGRFYRYGINDSTYKNKINLVAFRVSYSAPVRKLDKQVFHFHHAEIRDGLWQIKEGFHKTFASVVGSKNYTKVFAYYKIMVRPTDIDNEFLPNPNLWSNNTINSSVRVGTEKQKLTSWGSLKTNAELVVPGLIAQNNNSYFNTQILVNLTKKRFDLKWRFFGQIGMNNIAESNLYLYGANPEQEYDNRWYRAYMFPESLYYKNQGRTPANVQLGGGLNVRGYARYFVLDAQNNFITVGNTGLATNIELDFVKLLRTKWHNKVPYRLRGRIKWNPYLFYDAGYITNIVSNSSLVYNSMPNTRILQDAGLGVAFTLPAPRGYTSSPFVLRIDLPFWLSYVPEGQNPFQFRWVVGIGRCF